MRQASKKINENLDVVLIVKKFAQINRLAYLLLNEKQKVVFDNLPKPYLSDSRPKRRKTVKFKEEREEKRKKLRA